MIRQAGFLLGNPVLFLGEFLHVRRLHHHHDQADAARGPNDGPLVSNRHCGIHSAGLRAHASCKKQHQVYRLARPFLYLHHARDAAASAAALYLLRAADAAAGRRISGAGPVYRCMPGLYLELCGVFCEIFRGGLLAIDKGQYEASQVLGLNKWQTMTRIILPQMFRVALPAVSNESITLIKDTALLYAVAVPELLHFAQTAVNRDFTIVPFFIAGMIYLLMTLLLTALFKWLEQRFKFE